MMRKAVAPGLILLMALAAVAAAQQALAKDPGCENATLVSTGGQAPARTQTLAIRWTGFSNFELAEPARIETEFHLLRQIAVEQEQGKPAGFVGDR